MLKNSLNDADKGQACFLLPGEFLISEIKRRKSEVYFFICTSKLIKKIRLLNDKSYGRKRVGKKLEPDPKIKPDTW